MPITALIICVQNPSDKKTYLPVREYNLSNVGYFFQNTAKDSFKFVVRETFQGLDRNSRHSVSHNEYLVHMLMDTEQIGGYIFVDKDYPRRVAFDFLKKTIDCFKQEIGNNWKNIVSDDGKEFASIKKLFSQFQDPINVDQLSSAQKKVDETEIILHDNLKKLLERQGDLDQMVAKSNDLSKSAKAFYKTSKSANSSCCVIF